MITGPEDNLFDEAYACLMMDSPEIKIRKTRQLEQRWQAGELGLISGNLPERILNPGRPVRPKLVHPREVPRRGFASRQGKARLVHAIAHIEFNAINLALDAVYRFRDMPAQYYMDWLKISVEEAMHFSLLSSYLDDMDVSYGDYEAHNGLWEMAVKTDHDVLVRMALVPRVLEARGLDVTPDMIKKLKALGDEELVDILNIIYRDEIGHVKIGSHWFKALCLERSLPVDSTFDSLLDQYMAGANFGPFDREVRLKAGFSEREIENLINRSQNI